MSALIAQFTQEQIAEIEANEETTLDLNGEKVVVTAADFEITSEDMPGWLVASEGKLTVALDITITEELRREGVARELVNRIQNIRKDSGFEVTDKISVEIEANDLTTPAVESFAQYIAQQTLAVDVKVAAAPAGAFVVDTDIDEVALKIAVTKA
jgi:isoleucyl-tRNA synthetase